MAKLVECVPNFSEGRRVEVVDALAAAVAATPDVHLLDRTSDVDHNRSVLTFAGEAEAVAVAMEAAVEVAIDKIDMEQHEGQHPRIGAVDVIPFVPLGDTTMDECVELARRFGAHIAERFELPVYLYAKAAHAGPSGSSWLTSASHSTRASSRISRISGVSPTSARPACIPPPAPWPSALDRS